MGGGGGGGGDAEALKDPSLINRRISFCSLLYFSLETKTVGSFI